MDGGRRHYPWRARRPAGGGGRVPLQDPGCQRRLLLPRLRQPHGTGHLRGQPDRLLPGSRPSQGGVGGLSSPVLGGAGPGLGRRRQERPRPSHLVLVHRRRRRAPRHAVRPPAGGPARRRHRRAHHRPLSEPVDERHHGAVRGPHARPRAPDTHGRLSLLAAAGAQERHPAGRGARSGRAGARRARPARRAHPRAPRLVGAGVVPAARRSPRLRPGGCRRGRRALGGVEPEPLRQTGVHQFGSGRHPGLGGLRPDVVRAGGWLLVAGLRQPGEGGNEW